MLLLGQSGDVRLGSGHLAGKSLSFVGLNVTDAIGGNDRRRQVVGAATTLGGLGELSGEPDLTQARPAQVTRVAMAVDVLAGRVRGRRGRGCRSLEILNLIPGLLLKPLLGSQRLKRIAQTSFRDCHRGRIGDRCTRRIELYAVSEQGALDSRPPLGCFLEIVGECFVPVGQLIERSGVVGTNAGRRYRFVQVGTGINPDVDEPAPQLV